MIALGLDPGLASCGFALVAQSAQGVGVCDLGTLVTVKGEKLLRDRFDELVVDVVKLVDEWRPGVLVLEAPSFPKGASAAAQVWGSYAALVAIARARGLYVVVRGASEWRRLLGLASHKGDGGAGRAARKVDTEQFVRRRFDGKALDLLLADTPKSERSHALDALAIVTSWLDRAAPAPSPQTVMEV